MSGYEGSHQDWLEDQASDALEREAYSRERDAERAPDGPEVDVSRFDDRIVLQGDGFEIVRVGDEWEVWTDRDSTFTDEQMVNLAHAILSEVEIAQRGDD